MISDAKRYRRAILAFLLQRDGGNCGVCGKPLGSDGGFYVTIDHIIPHSEGGPDTFENFRLAHRACNTGVYWRGRSRPYCRRQKVEAKTYVRQPRPDVVARNRSVQQKEAVRRAWEAGRMELSRTNLNRLGHLGRFKVVN